MVSWGLLYKLSYAWTPGEQATYKGCTHSTGTGLTHNQVSKLQCSTVGAKSGADASPCVRHKHCNTGAATAGYTG